MQLPVGIDVIKSEVPVLVFSTDKGANIVLFSSRRHLECFGP